MRAWRHAWSLMVIRTEAMVGEGQVGSEAGVDEGRGDVAVAVVGDGGTYVSNASGRVRILFAHAQPALFLL